MLELAYYPYSSQLRVFLDLRAVPAPGVRGPVELVLRRRGREEMARFPLELPETRVPRWDELLSIPRLEPGDYVLDALFTTRIDCAPIAARRRFRHAVFGWEHNRLGDSAEVIPPFVPLGVTGRRVRAVLREHLVNELGLWDQVQSIGQPLLARPIALEIELNGRRVAVEPSASPSCAA